MKDKTSPCNGCYWLRGRFCRRPTAIYPDWRKSVCPHSSTKRGPPGECQLCAQWPLMCCGHVRGSCENFAPRVEGEPRCDTCEHWGGYGSMLLRGPCSRICGTSFPAWLGGDFPFLWTEGSFYCQQYERKDVR